MEMHLPAFVTGLSEMCQEMQRCRKNVMMVLKMCTSRRHNVSEMYANYGLWNACCTVPKVETISSAFKWLIILSVAIKTCDQTH